MSGWPSVIAPTCGSRGAGFKSHWRQNSACDRLVRSCIEPFIITLPSSLCDLNNVERDKKKNKKKQKNTIVSVFWISYYSVVRP